MPQGKRIKETTCYMCACRCGIRVHLDGDRVTYIEGNPDHPVNRGVLCAKGSAGIKQHYSPARLKKPLLRTGERGSGEFREIEWDEALELAAAKLAAVRADDPKKLAFYTGRDQSQALTAWWAAQYGTPNYAAHGGFCSVNMAAAGLYSIGGSFWEFGEPDWQRTRYLMMFGVAEDHDSNPIKIGIGQIKSRADTKFVSINPVRTGYSAVADEWVGIRPGTDGLLVGALIAELLRAEKIDWQYLGRYTNAFWLIHDAPGTDRDGLFVRNADGDPLVYDKSLGEPAKALDPGVKPAIAGEYLLADGSKVRPAFHVVAEEYLGGRYDVDVAARGTGIPATTIRRLAAELAETAFDHEITLDQPWTDWTGRRHETLTGRPVSFHAMRGISAHANGFDTCRMIHLLQMLLGAIDCPGGFLYKPPFPRPCPPPKKPARGVTAANMPIETEPLGFPISPDDLAVDATGAPLRLDKAYSWEHPIAAHGMMHMVLENAWAGDPYKIDVLFLYMANMAWNSSMNVKDAILHLTDKDPDTGDYKIPFIIYSDAYYSETVPYADLVLPDTTYLERWDAISMLDRPIGSAHAAADSIRHPVVAPDRDVRAFQDVLIDLGARLGLGAFTNKDGSARFPEGYKDYIVNHERVPGVGTLAGWRGADGQDHGTGDPNPDQLDRYIENGGFWEQEIPEGARHYRFANQAYHEHARTMGWYAGGPIVLNLYSEILQTFRLAAEGHGVRQPPDHLRDRVRTTCRPIPSWDPPPADDAYPLSAITQRPMHMYHSWGSQNTWLRQITSRNSLYMHHDLATAHDLVDGDWVIVTSEAGTVRAPVKIMSGVNPHTVWTWNAIGKRKGAWALDADAPEFSEGFLLNHVISGTRPTRDGRESNSDPVTGQAAWFDARVRIEKCSAPETVTAPLMPAPASPDLATSIPPCQRPDAVPFLQQIEAMTGAHIDYISWQTRHDKRDVS